MKIGVPKEIKSQEARVGLTPAGALTLIRSGHQLSIQKGAGLLSGISDEEYLAVGCSIVPNIEMIYAQSEMIIKVKEPIEEEFKLIQAGQLLFTYFHFASSATLTKAMIDSRAICLAYETVEENGKIPLLIPMSEVAGRMATQEGAKYLEKPFGGFGILLGGVTGVQPANVTPVFSNSYTIEQELMRSHLIIGTVLIPGSKAPKLIRKEMLAKMMPGTVLVDVAIDQGGCFETSEPTTHDSPIVIKEGIIHYAVTNMPGAVPNTSTTALTNATLSYALQLANKGWKVACAENKALEKGLNIIEGKVVYKEVAEAFDLEYIEASSLMH